MKYVGYCGYLETCTNNFALKITLTSFAFCNCFDMNAACWLLRSTTAGDTSISTLSPL